MIAGGGKLPDDVRDEFVKLAGEDKAKIVVIAGGDAKADEVLKPWREAKPTSIVLLHAADKKTAANSRRKIAQWRLAGIVSRPYNC